MRKHRHDLKAAYPLPDATIVAGVATTTPNADRRSMGRSEVKRGKFGTMANRRNGGGNATYKPRAEDLMGASRITPPSTAGVKSRTQHGIAIPNQQMTAVPASPEETLRQRVLDRTNLHNAGVDVPDNLHGRNTAWPDKWDFGTVKSDRQHTASRCTCATSPKCDYRLNIV